MKHSHPVPEPGCYVPAITFFNPETDTLDLKAQKKYFQYLSHTGLKGLVILGTNAETFLLTREERYALIELARASVPSGFPIIAGVGGHSTAQVLEFITDAKNAGADFAMVLPAAYFGKQTTPAVVHRFYDQVAAKSQLPIIIYNFPGVCNGLDMESDMIADIARRHDNVVGVKLTCGSVAKITRLAAQFPHSRFAVFGGQADFLLGGLAVGSSGCIAAFANVFPKSVARVYELWKKGQWDEALKLHRTLALAESMTKSGIASTKYATAVVTAPRAGIANPAALLRPRAPYEEPDGTLRARIQDALGKLAYLEDDDQMLSAKL